MLNARCHFLQRFIGNFYLFCVDQIDNFEQSKTNFLFLTGFTNFPNDHIRNTRVVQQNMSNNFFELLSFVGDIEKFFV